jgi:hypothetical protein
MHSDTRFRRRETHRHGNASAGGCDAPPAVMPAIGYDGP